jgi:hypothetical protein
MARFDVYRPTGRPASWLVDVHKNSAPRLAPARKSLAKRQPHPGLQLKGETAKRRLRRP